MIKRKKRLTRKGFEGLIQGEWVDDGRRRNNGKFYTWVNKPWKYITDSKSTLRAKSWLEIAKALEIK